MAPVRPTDIPRPRVARDPGVTARPSAPQLRRVSDPRAEAFGDLAAGTRDKAAATRSLATTKRQSGRQEAAALEGLASSQERGGAMVAGAESEAGQRAAADMAAFSKLLGNVASSFERIEKNRQDAEDRVWEDTWELEAAKRSSEVTARASTAPGEGRDFIEGVDSELDSVFDDVTANVTEKMGRKPSQDALDRIQSRRLALRANAARQTAVLANNQRVIRMDDDVTNNVLGIAREAGSTGDLADGLNKVRASVAALDGVLAPDKLRAKREAAENAVYKAVVLGHLERGEVEEARTLVDAVTGFAGPNSNEVHQALIGAAKNEGIDPVYLLALSYHETAGTFDPKSRTWKDPNGPFVDENGVRRASSAGGLIHMISGTSRDYLNTPDATKASFTDQAIAAAKFTGDNRRKLKSVLGGEPTPGELFLAQLLGRDGAAQVLSAPDDTPLRNLQNKRVIKNSSGLVNGTVADLKAWAAKMIEARAEKVRDLGLIEGRDIAAGFGSVPMDTAISLSASVAAKERTLLAEEKKQAESFQDNFTAKKPRKERDPVGYLMKYDEGTRERFMAAQAVLAQEGPEEPKALVWQKAVADSLNAQRNAGLSLRDTKVLPVGQATQIVTALKELKGSEAATAFYSWQERAGPHWDKLLGELTDQGLPAQFQLLGMIDRAANPDQAKLVAQTIGLDPKALKENLGTDGSDEVKTLLGGIEDELGDFGEVFQFAPFGGAQVQGQFSSIMDAVKTAALTHYIKTGNANEAQRIGIDLIEKNIESVKSPSLRVLLPVEAGISERELEVATDFKMSRAEIERFEPRTFGGDYPVYQVDANPKGLVERGNLDLSRREVIQEGGQYMTSKAFSINVDGAEVLIPRVVDGELLDEEEAIQHFQQTGEHFGVFDSPENATAYAKKQSDWLDKYYQPGKEHPSIAMRERQHRRDFTISAATRGVWITNPTGDGVMLIVKAGDTWEPLTDPSGKTYEIGFSEMKEVAKAGAKGNYGGTTPEQAAADAAALNIPVGAIE